MAIDSELLMVLDAEELRDLLALASVANARDLLKRDLLSRRDEIELELSSATAARDEAIANKQVADKRVSQRLDTGRHATRLRVSLWVLGLCTVAALASVLFNWPLGKQLLASWHVPFTSSWIAAVVWIVIYALVVLAAFEAYFYLRRLPVRRLQVRRDEKTTDFDAALESAKAARSKQLAEIVRDHVTEMLNSSQGPMYANSLRVRSDKSSNTGKRFTLSVGLSEVTNEDSRVATGVQQRLVQLLTKLPGASIGISGPRGVGKSTLLAAMCSANPTIEGRAAIAINTSAPVEYDGRDFLLHLFSSLCRQVLRTEGQERAIEEDRSSLLEARRWQRASLLEELPPIARLIAFTGLLLIGVALMLAAAQSLTFTDPATHARVEVPTSIETSVAKPSPEPAPVKGQAPAQPISATSAHSPISSPHVGGYTQTTVAVPTQSDPESKSTMSPAPAASNVSIDTVVMLKAFASAPLFTLGATALILGFTILCALGPYGRLISRFISRSEPHRRPYFASRHSELVQRAIRELRNINFQRSYTSGWSGGLKIPVGLEMGSSAGLTLAQQPESLPELVERFRSFVRNIASAYDNVVLIGIDELDKLKGTQQAEAFLNGVKSVFGIQRCFYLISVSEHALAAFERRGIGFRDAFDSALDDVIQLDFLDLDQSRVLLGRRILRLPDPFLQLCHMLSGGLPRDLIRHARALLDCAAESPNGALSLSNAVDQMAARDLTTRLRATSIAMRTVREIAETNDLLINIAALPAATDINGAAAALAPFRAHVAELTKLRDSEEGRTLLRFAEELAVYYEMMILLRRVAALLSTKEGWKRATAFGFANQLAGVRQALEVSVPLAEIRLAELRKAIDDAATAIDRTKVSAP